MKFTEQQAKFDVIRKAWGLAKPKYNRLPKWFRDKTQNCVIPHKIFDHIGVIKDEHYGQIAIFEPYESSCNTGEAREIARCIANEINCCCYVSIKSYWYPGRTIRIEFFQKTYKELPQ